ncbi:MAG: DNA primase [Phycisphaerae bacterium]|nr:DNA primase [Phycisphaerae bacterium]MCZ2400823.1 DNA primase [Phycisphaerae bacterium]NUQ48360.1 DNA primase [Phycisphaerae bacterium]
MHNSLKDKVLESVDIVDLIGERVSLKRKGKELIGLCPFHDDHSPSLSVSPVKRIFKCWSCGAGGDAIEFVRRLHRVEYSQALRMLAERAGIRARASVDDSREHQQRDALRSVLDWARSHFERNLGRPEGRAAREYALSRGLTEDTIRRRRLGLAAPGWDTLLHAGEKAGVSRDLLVQAGLVALNENGKAYDRFRNRLMFPINDPLGRCIAFGGRTLADDDAKYLNSPESPLFSKSRVLFDLDVARDSIGRSRTALVVEGYLDAVLVAQAGVTNVVATLGTALTDSHVKLLKPYVDTLILCFDNDDAGVRAADRALEVALRHQIVVKVAIMTGGKDPADCVLTEGRDGLNRHLQSALDALEFKWRRTVHAFNAEGPQAKRAAVEELVRFVGRVGAAGGLDPIAQGQIASRLAELASLSTAAVYGMLTAARGAGRRPQEDGTSTSGELSAYATEVRALPAGLVRAAEELFGLILSRPASYGEAAGSLGACAGFNRTWRRLLDVCEAAQAQGEFSRERVVANCDDAALCELVSRAAARAEDTEPDDVARAGDRIRAELDLMRIEGLGGHLLGRGAPDEQAAAAFRSLLDLSRKRSGISATAPSPLAADHRLRVRGTEA